MFNFSAEPIDIEVLRRKLEDSRAGALVTFEGRVRNHNDGQQVLLLEYEAYEPLAIKEAQRIMEEAQQQFEVYECICVHRTGKLQIGDVAVWVGVIAAHRDAAFSACRYVIDEIKGRVPIWKKEHYADGRVDWVNCAHHSHIKDTHPVAGSHEVINLDFSVPKKESAKDWELDILDMSGAEIAQFQIIDIREPGEDTSRILKSLLHQEIIELPLSRVDQQKPNLDKGKKYLFICQRGARSAKLVAALRAAGWQNVYSLAGGVEAVRRKFIA